MKKLGIVFSILIIAVVIAIGVIVRPPITVNGVSSGIGLSKNIEASLQNNTFLEVVEIGGETYSLGELGVSLDEEALTEVLRNDYIFIPSNWGKRVSVPFVVDEVILERALESNPRVFAPVNATVSREDNQFVVVTGESGYTVSSSSLISALESGSRSVDLEEVSPVDDGLVVQEVERVNSLIVSGIPVYRGDLEVGRVSGELIANAFDMRGVRVELSDSVSGRGLEQSQSGSSQSGGMEFVEVEEIGEDKPVGSEVLVLDYSLSATGLQSLADSIIETASVIPVSGEAIVDSDGEPIKVLEEWVDGFEVDSEGLVEIIEKSLVNGGPIVVNGETVAAEVKGLYRAAVVNKSERWAYFYENGVLVNSFPIAVGKPGWETTVGTFKVNVQLAKQDMGCLRPDLGYCTKDVPWITYFNGDQGFHGTYWHEDFGNPFSSNVSHGCVNMRTDDALWVYEFLTVGSTVTINP